MMQIKLYNKIAKVGTDVFDREKFSVGEEIEDPDGVMVRSADLHGMAVGEKLLAVARAGAGVNNIPCEELAERGVVVFNTPGANANGVKELAIAALILASRGIADGIAWAKTLGGEPDVAQAVEKGKSKFSGHEILGKTLGVIGLGAIGGLVANAARSLGMHVVGCDPYMTVQAAWNLSSSVEKASSYDEIYACADYITLHVPSTPSTRGMIDRETIAKMKDGVRLINLARADLVDPDALKEALASGKIASYVTDFPTEATLALPGAINIPHLGASTEESEDNCAVMAAEELVEYITTGNIRNSVNYPAVSLPKGGAARICILHRNVANMLSQFTAAISSEGINIEHLSNGSKGSYAYTMIELGVAAPEAVISAIRAVDGVLKVRVL